MALVFLETPFKHILMPYISFVWFTFHHGGRRLGLPATVRENEPALLTKIK